MVGMCELRAESLGRYDRGCNYGEAQVRHEPYRCMQPLFSLCTTLFASPCATSARLGTPVRSRSWPGAQVIATADAMVATGLARAGYTYVSVDDWCVRGWERVLRHAG